VWELAMFLIIGGLGGVIGAVFNQANQWLAIWRKKFFQSQVSVPQRSLKKLAEAMAVTFIMSSLTFFLPLWFNGCRPVIHLLNMTVEEHKMLDGLVRFQCEEGEYNELASLMFTEGDAAIRHLFHFREMGNGDLEDATFKLGTLITFFMVYFIMAVVTYGLSAFCFFPTRFCPPVGEVEPHRICTP
jgi:chloride channel 7